MSRASIILAFFLLLTGIGCGRDGFILSAEAGEGGPSPHFEGEAIPAPPMQEQPWTPPETKLSEVVVSAVKLLFEQGLADPRGCEYRDIEIAAGNCWSGDGGVVKIHAWVFPVEEGQKQRFAVCWNGLVYPVISVGAKADCRQDVKALLKTDRERIDERMSEYKRKLEEAAKKTAETGKEHSVFKPTVRYNHAIAEGSGASHSTILPMKAVLLLRQGHGDLAQELWLQWFAGREDEAGKDPYPLLTRDWIWALFDRALCAHMRGDDRLALLGARILFEIEPKIWKDAQKREFESGSAKGGFLGFLKPLPGLLADQERRAKEPECERVLDAPEKCPDKAKRIAALIRDLEEVSSRQWGQPGGVNVAGDPIVKALVEEGEDAVEPLIECLEKDNRLTRSVSFGRSFHRGRSTISVASAALAALRCILRTSDFGEGTDTRAGLASKIRAHWDRFKGHAIEESWYGILADDNASPKQWLEAAASIVRPADVRIEGQWVVTPPRKPGEIPPMSGEPLRGRKNPSVAELMAKRVEQMTPGLPLVSSMNAYAMYDACKMTLHLAKWDIEEALPTLRTQMKCCLEFISKEKGALRSSVTSLGRYIAEFTLERIRAKDPGAVAEYTEWLRTATPDMLEDGIMHVFKPVWRYPDEPDMNKTAEWLFGSDESPWARLTKTAGKGPNYDYYRLTETPLMGVAQFQKDVLKELGSKAEAGTVVLQEDGSAQMHAHSGWSSGEGYWKEEFPQLEAGKVVKFRVCDLTARMLSKLDGTPKCRLYWPQEERDKAVKACIAFLQQYGDCFRYAPHLPKRDEYWEEDEACIAFERLDHPATRDKVKRGLAIFSLEGEGELRLWRMPVYPLEAEWTAIEDSSSTRRRTDKSGGVWQAEEVRKNDKWERYYGFVGRYTIAKVPASEMEFPADYYRWSKLSRGIDCCICPPGGTQQKNARTVFTCEIGEPLVMTAWLRSRSGLDLTAPLSYHREDEEGNRKLLSGVSIKLEYTAEKPASPYNPYQDNRKWENLSLKRTAHFVSDKPGRVLAPTEEFEAFKLDLNEWFDLKKPGSYRAYIIFSGECGFTEGKSHPAMFILQEDGK